MKPGYKQTEVGVIPEDWDGKTLDAIGSVIRGASPRPKGDRRYYGGNVPRLMVEDVTRDKRWVTPSIDFLTEEGAKRSRPCKRGTLTIVCSGTPTVVGLPSLLAVDACIHDGMLALVHLDKGVSSDFLFHQLRSIQERLHAAATHGGTFVNLTTTGLKSFKVILPPTKAEQEAIAEALSDADGLIESLEQLLAKKRQLKQGAMQKLLTGKKRLPGFSGEWVVKRLGDVIEKFIGGGTPSRSNPQYWGDEIPWVTVKDFATFNPRYSQEAITKVGLQNSASHLIPRGTLITSTRMALGKAVVYEVNVAINQDLKALFPKPVLAMQYLYFWFQYYGQSIDELGSGSTVKGISLPDLKKMEFQLPTIEEQTAIAAILSDLDAELAFLESKLTKARRIKQGMMQELLTGRIRLVQSTARIIPLPTQKQTSPATAKSHNWQINEAVIIGVLAKHFGSEKFPLARKRCTKLTYLLHRHVERQAGGYLKKAAGPYNPAVKYKGPEGIAQKNGYVRPHHNGTYPGFVAAGNITEAEAYFTQWYGPEVLPWLEQFRFKKTDELELLTTVDMAMEDLRREGQAVNLGAVKQVIHDHPEWEAKLEREIFADPNIIRAIDECREFLGN